MNTVKKGAAYEAAFRAQYKREGTEIFWQPPKPRAHSTGYDAMCWWIVRDEYGEIQMQSEATLWEFKSSRLSCTRARRLQEQLERTRPAFVHVAVVHRTTTAEFCEH